MVERDVRKVRTPMVDAFKALTLAKIILRKKDKEKVKGAKIKKRLPLPIPSRFHRSHHSRLSRFLRLITRDDGCR